MSDAQDKPVLEQDDSAKENKADSAEGVFVVPAPKAMDAEKAEEAKLTAKYPDLKKRAGKSALVQKRLSKGTRYFDSGDYNMAKSKMAPGKSPFSIVPPSAPGGGPPPSALAAAKSQQPAPAVLPAGSTGEEIPTPQTIQQCRKPSIVSKLAADHLLQ